MLLIFNEISIEENRYRSYSSNANNFELWHHQENQRHQWVAEKSFSTRQIEELIKINREFNWSLLIIKADETTNFIHCIIIMGIFDDQSMSQQEESH